MVKTPTTTCTTASPGTGWTCVNGSWQPPTTTTGTATTPAVPVWPNDFTYIGKTTLASAPYPNDAYGSPVGDFRFGKGLAVHAEPDGSVSIFAGSWNPQPVLRWRTTPVNGTFSGNATFVRSLGTGVYVHGELIGLFVDDEGDLISSFNSTYDGTSTIDWTMPALTSTR